MFAHPLKLSALLALVACGSAETTNTLDAASAADAPRSTANPSRLWSGDASCVYAPSCPQTPPVGGTPCVTPVICDYGTSPNPRADLGLPCGPTARCAPSDAGIEAGRAWQVAAGVPCPPLEVGGNCPTVLPPDLPILVDCPTAGQTCPLEGRTCICDPGWVPGRQLWNCMGLIRHGCSCNTPKNTCGPWFCDGPNGLQEEPICPD